MNSRERVESAINHVQPDRVPIDLSGHGQSGINASVLYKLREKMGLERKPIEIFEVLQLLGTVDRDCLEYVGADCVPLIGAYNMFGCSAINGTKPFTMPDGTPCLIAKDCAFKTMPDGRMYAYPKGDMSCEPCAVLPAGGTFFDAVDRVKGFDEDALCPKEDFKDAFGLMDDDSFAFYKEKSKELYENTEYAIIGNLGGGALGDAALIPGMHEKHPKGIRTLPDWFMAHILYPDYIKEVFRMQTDVMLQNLERYKKAVGNRIQVIWVSGTDFGTQNATSISIQTFRELYKPFYTEINKWIHENTQWKTLYHSCGAVADFLDDFVEMGVDILNPVQLSAKGMDGPTLKEKYGDRLTFWGGGIDTQKTLPFGSVEEVKAEVKERLRYFSKGGGYIFNTVHNILANSPVENILAMYEAVHEFNEGK